MSHSFYKIFKWTWISTENANNGCLKEKPNSLTLELLIDLLQEDKVCIYVVWKVLRLAMNFHIPPKPPSFHLSSFCAHPPRESHTSPQPLET